MRFRAQGKMGSVKISSVKISSVKVSPVKISPVKISPVKIGPVKIGSHGYSRLPILVKHMIGGAINDNDESQK